MDYPHQAKPDTDLSPRTRRVALYIVLGVVALLLWFAGRVFLLFFTSILLALFLRGLSCWLTQRTSLSKGWALAVVMTALLVVGALAGWLVIPRMANQIPRLTQELSQALQHAQQQITQSRFGQEWLQTLDLSKWVSQIPNAFTKVSVLLSSGVGLIVDLAVIFFIGLYLAIQPAVYREGLLRLLPLQKRARPREISEVAAQTLQRWLVGRLILMVFNAIVTSLGLWLLGIPLALSLGVLSGLLNFVPNIGPVIAALPALLLAFVQSPLDALYVFLLYVVYQNVDGFVLTPLVQRRTVSLPPALTLMSQVLLGVLLGPMGVILAVPLMATLLVVVKMAYVQDVLGEDVSLPGQK